MNAETRARLFGIENAFDHAATAWIIAGVGALLLVTPLLILLVSRRGTPQRQELFKRYLTWLFLAPAMLGPILLGAAWTIGAVAILSLLCYGEYARATGLFREKAISLVVVIGILFVMFAVADHWYGFFVALFPLTVATIATIGILADRPKGYIQRVALGVLGFVLFGCCLGHLGYMANDSNYRPIVLLVLLGVEMNDVFAYVVGKTLGDRRLAPNTSPQKTVAGALGALTLTTLLVGFLAHHVFAKTPLDHPIRLAALGLVLSVVGQLGDLMLSSIKRDLGIKDIGVTLPGHGGLLDRFNSLILVSPAVFHYVNYFVGFGLDQESRILSGG